MVTGESDEETGDDEGVLHPLSAAEQYTKRIKRTCIYDCTLVRNVG
jgi:hypothetical protein